MSSISLLLMRKTKHSICDTYSGSCNVSLSLSTSKRITLFLSHDRIFTGFKCFTYQSRAYKVNREYKLTWSYSMIPFYQDQNIWKLAKLIHVLARSMISSILVVVCLMCHYFQEPQFHFACISNQTQFEIMMLCCLVCFTEEGIRSWV